MENKLQKHILLKGDCPLHYYTSEWKEDGITLVLVHGIAVDHHSYDQLIECLPEDRYNILSMDMRAHGKSQPNDKKLTKELLLEDILDVLEKAGVQKAIFVGQGLGGSLVQDLLFQHPGMVQALAILGAACSFGRISMAERITYGIMSTVISTYRFEKLRQNVSFSNSARVEGREYTHRCITRMEKKDLVTLLKMSTRMTHYEKDYRSEVPGFCALGVLNADSSVEKINAVYQSCLPNVDCYRIVGCASIVQYDAPEQVAELLQRMYLKMFDPEQYQEVMEKFKEEYEKEMLKVLERQRKEAEKARKRAEEQRKKEAAEKQSKSLLGRLLKKK